MAKRAAGILLYHFSDKTLLVLLAHPGGPFWAKKDLGVWSIPKGEYDDDETPIDAAQREFMEETGFDVDVEDAIELKPIKLKGGKVVTAFAVEGEFDVMKLKSNTFSMEWPLKSGRQQTFAEIDRAEWFTLEEAREKIKPEQAALLDELDQRLK